MTARVLVVDDIFPNVKLLEAKLRAEYYDVVTALSGPEALKKIVEESPDVVLLDVMMPGQLDGIQVCERIRADPEIAHIPVVMLTARSQQTDLEAGRRAGCNAYLTKPFSPLQLIETVERLAAAETGR